MSADRTDFYGLESDSPGFMVLRDLDGVLGIGLAVEADGDLDLVMTRQDARKLGEALLRAAADHP